jgi:hypothetical protein
MENWTISIALVGVVPSVCDAEAGAADRLSTDTSLDDSSWDRLADQTPPSSICRTSVREVSSVSS